MSAMTSLPAVRAHKHTTQCIQPKQRTNKAMPQRQHTLCDNKNRHKMHTSTTQHRKHAVDRAERERKRSQHNHQQQIRNIDLDPPQATAVELAHTIVSHCKRFLDTATSYRIAMRSGIASACIAVLACRADSMRLCDTCVFSTL